MAFRWSVNSPKGEYYPVLSHNVAMVTDKVPPSFSSVMIFILLALSVGLSPRPP